MFNLTDSIAQNYNNKMKYLQVTGTAAEELGFVKRPPRRPTVFHGNKAMARYRRPLDAVQRLKVLLQHHEPGSWRAMEEQRMKAPAVNNDEEV